MPTVENLKDILAGVLFIAIGALALLLVRGLAIGEVVSMGPAYVPTILGWLIIMLGGVILVRGFVVRGSRLEYNGLKVPGLILLSVLLFGFTLERLGLVIASLLLMGVSSYAVHDVRWRETALWAIVLIALSVLVFTVLLGLNMRVLPL